MYQEQLTDEEVTLILQDYERKTMVESLTGPAISFVTHLVLLCLLMTFITTHNPPPEEFVINTVKIEEVELPEEIQDEIDEIQDEVTEDVTEITEVQAPESDPGEETSPEDVSDEAPSTDDNTDQMEVCDFVNNDSPLKFTGPIGGRKPSGRKKQIGKTGGPTTKIGQEKLKRAMRWLAQVQNDNGSWGNGKNWGPDLGNGHPAHTGLALLVFLAHGETPLSETYGATVQKAMRWLANYGSQSDLRRVVTKRPGGYAHGIATYALSEAYAMTKIPFLRSAMENSINEVIEGQMSNGGFAYGYSSGPRWDTSVAGWNIQALKAARMAGSTNEKLKEAIKKSISFCQKVAYAGNGGFAYAQGKEKKARVSMGGIGAVALQLLGHGNDKRVAKAAENIGKERLEKYLEVKNDPTKWNEIAGNCLYSWYYDTQVIFNTQNRHKKRWRAWRNAFETVLIKTQKAEGYWETNGKHHIGTSDTAGRVLSTCFCCLQLEVYYRYLPTFDRSKMDKFAVEDETVGDGGMTIEITD